MNTTLLEQEILQDKKSGDIPFFVVGTVGTTGTGAIDDLEACANICKKYDLWFHVDAAYGGAVAVSATSTKWLKGIECSNSITLDLHKWFSTPMGASLFLTSEQSILHQTFKLSTKYMPENGDQIHTIDPYIHSMQWSRRFIGLKIYLPLAVFGWQKFENAIYHQIRMGDMLRNKLRIDGWIIVNRTPLPVVCFSLPEANNNVITKIVNIIVEEGNAWVSTYQLGKTTTIRACITNYSTSESDVDELIRLLRKARDQVYY